MYNVQYDLSGEQDQTKPVTLYTTEVANPSSGDSLTRRTITFSVTESSSFTFSQSITLGISVEITAGIPIIGAGQKTTISASATSTVDTGSTTSKTYTDSIQANINLPGMSKTTAVIEGAQLQADIPFTATVKKVYYDGTFGQAQISGVYKGVDIAKYKVTYGVFEKL